MNLGLELRTRVCEVSFSCNRNRCSPTSFSLHRFSLSPQKPKIPLSAWPIQVADHLVPNRILRLFEFQGERERGEVFCFQRLARAFIGADSKNLKMRRLPPTTSSRISKIHAERQPETPQAPRLELWPLSYTTNHRSQRCFKQVCSAVVMLLVIRIER